MNTSFAGKIKKVREHNFEDGAKDSELDKDTDVSNLNSKVEYLSLTLNWFLLGSILVKYDLVFLTQSVLLLYKRS